MVNIWYVTTNILPLRCKLANTYMFIYNICIQLYSYLIRLAAFKLPKAKLWCDGRKQLFENMQRAISPSDRIIWIHVASLGEFEQGRPLIEHFKATHPEYKILLTFFSPSGYEVRKNYEGADYIFYLPIDTTNNARRFLEIAHPEIAIFVKYEYWLNLLFELRRRKVRSYIVSAIFRRNSIFFKSYGSKWRKALESFETLFVQDSNSLNLLAELGFDNVVVAGDTRFDRVMEIANNVKSIPIVEQFKGNSELFVAGSTWLPDETILAEIAKRHTSTKFVIAPHEIKEENVSNITKLFGESNVVRYTTIAAKQETAEATEMLNKAQVLILDTMGMLSSLYQYGEFSYIGGGFGVGIHNTLEAATFGLPIAFGPNYSRFKEANDLVSLGAAASVADAEGLDVWFTKLITDREVKAMACRAAKEYTSNMSGATAIISRTIFCE